MSYLKFIKMENFRQHPRFDYKLKVACLTDFQVLEAEVENFSLSGVCLLLPREIKPGKEMGLIFKFPFPRMFVVSARVVWSSQDCGDLNSPRYKAGVEFFYLPSFCREQFESLQTQIAS